jgi:preprotein translocase subunit SecG
VQTLILTLHIIVCVLLVILVLLQAGKEGMGVIFGGGNSSVFGSTGAGGMLAKLTAFAGLLFIITSLSYTFVTSSRPADDSAVLDVNVQFEEKAQPAAPAQPEAAKTESPAAQPAAPAAAAPAQPEAAKTESPAAQPAAPAAAAPAQPEAAKTEAPAAQPAAK